MRRQRTEFFVLIFSDYEMGNEDDLSIGRMYFNQIPIVPDIHQKLIVPEGEERRGEKDT